MVLRLISCSPRRRIRLVTVVRGLKVSLMPGWATSLRELDTSNGCQNDTFSPSAALRLSQRLRRAKRRSSACHSSAHEPYDPPCHPQTSPDAAASTASRPALVTTRDRPSDWNETARLSDLIWVGREGKYFCNSALTKPWCVRGVASP